MLRPIGQLVRADANGFLPRVGACPEEPWASAARQLAEDSANLLRQELVAVALRGSVARRTMVLGVSDIDVVLVTQHPIAHPEMRPRITTPDFAFDISTMTRDDLLQSPRMAWMRFSLAFSGWSVWGEDIVSALPEPRLDHHAIAHLRGVSRWSMWEPMFDAAPEVERKPICQWLMKRIVRSLFESVMGNLGIYSRDIYPCAQIASDHYPAHRSAIWHAASLAVEPSTEKQVLVQATQSLIPLIRALADQARDTQLH
jgi:hypothetical protein